ncbi:hypothetical protein GL218_08454 [Daldinia childiae]|uniref:uncharacterized protein n=1 Tax=Daldinia childiae TaxID=326645 RepID=UPI001447F526|nr:uncharacterized protein GL218_08454 [Daldinia childiae]KAF3067418.1 hypothetical protein GL218_08454 [Daldinia childiae]
MPEEDLTKRRAVNACRRCKQRKVKCSGTAPCVNCTNRNQSCIFEEADRKIVISERHLRALERRAALRARSLQEANEIPSAIGREHIEQNVSGNNIRPPYTFSINEDCQNYPSTLGLPQHDYVIYLTGIVNFHLHSNCLFYNHTVSYNNIDRPPRTLEKTPSLRYANVFAIVALGKLLLERGATSFGPPGIEEFIQSVKALPSSVFLCQEPPLAIETLCILAIYAQAADKHIAAYLYVSQAISIARSCQFDKNENLVNGRNPNERQITQRLWWTACVLDQRLSIMIHASPNCSIEENVEHLLSNEETSVADVALLINLSLGYRSARAMTSTS